MGSLTFRIVQKHYVFAGINVLAFPLPGFIPPYRSCVNLRTYQAPSTGLRRRFRQQVRVRLARCWLTLIQRTAKHVQCSWRQ